MYTLSQLRRRVDALKRRYATDLTVIKLYPLAQDFSILWTCAVADGNPVPDTHFFIRSIARSGVRLNTFTLLIPYLERCRNEQREPDALGIISILLPQVPYQKLREMLRWLAPVLDQRAAESLDVPARRPYPSVASRPYWSFIAWLAASWRSPRYAPCRARPCFQGSPNVIRENPSLLPRRNTRLLRAGTSILGSVDVSVTNPLNWSLPP